MSNKDVIVEISQPEIIVEVEQVEVVTEVVVGQKGEDGQDGQNGQSAYQQAVEGGYTGTLEEFEAQLNALPELTGGADTDLHKHDQMYYTETEINEQMATKMNLDGSNSAIDTLTFKTTGQSTDPLHEGKARWNSVDKTLDLGMGGAGIVQQVGLETFYPKSRNRDSVTLPNGALVEYVGTLGNSGVMLIKRATSTMLTSHQIMGVTTEEIKPEADGRVTWFGQVRAIQTNGANYGETWVDGDILYNNPSYLGGLTKVRPTAPFPTAIVAVVMRAHASNGSLFVRPDFLPFLGDLSDVEITNPLDGQVMTYNGALGRWENKSLFTSSPVNRALVFYNSTTGLYETYGGLALDPTYLSLVTNGVFSYTTYNKDYGYLALGTHVASTTVSRNIADALPALIVNQANPSSTGRIQSWQFNSSTKAFMNLDGALYLASISNLNTGANAVVQLLDSGTKISRNVADANPSLIVNQANASSTGNILDLQFQGITKARFNRFGELYATRLGNITNNNNAYIDVTDTGSVIYRNIADANSALTVNQVHASSTGNILDLQFGGVSKASVSRTGNITAGYLFTSNGMGNSTTMNNALVSVPSTGTLISRDVADTNSVLTVDNVHASSSGYLLNLKTQGVTKAFVSREGVFYGSGIFNVVASSNSKIDTGLNGTKISRNVADTNPALIVNQANTGSTGKILDLQFGGVSKASIGYGGDIVSSGNASFGGVVIATELRNATANNAVLAVDATGARAYRNVADANPALKVNQQNASSTGNIAEFQFGGSTVSKLTRFGYLEAQGMYNPLGTAYSWVYTPSTGTIISRNLADANTALTVNHINTGSTGKLLDLQFGGVSKAHFDKDGILNGLVAITDVGNYYTSTDVEGALQEIGAKLVGLQAALDAILGGA